MITVTRSCDMCGRLIRVPYEEGDYPVLCRECEIEEMSSAMDALYDQMRDAEMLNDRDLDDF